MTRLPTSGALGWRGCAASLALVACASTLAGCGGGSGSTVATGPTSTGTTPTESSPTTTSPTSASGSGPTRVDFSATQLSRLQDVMYRAANGERAKRDRYFATADRRVRDLLDTVAGRVPAVVTRHPARARVHLAYVVAPYADNQLRCAPDNHTVDVLMVVGSDGIAFTTVVNTHTATSFRIFDSARAGKKPFDKDGFNVGAGPCRKQGSVEPAATRDIPLT